MSSEIRTNSLKSRAGLSTVTLTDSGPMFSGITTFVDNSGFNIGTGSSIFSPATNTLTFGTNSNERVRITSTGAINLTSENTTGWQLDAGDNSASYTAIDNHFPTTNRTLYINNETTHRSFVVWNKNGSDGYGFGLDNSGNFKVVYGTSERLRIASDGNLTIPGNSSVKDITYGDGTTTGYFRSSTNVNRASADQSIHMQQFRWNNTKVAEIKVITGDDTTNKDNAHIIFETASAGTTAERLRITADGEMGVNTTAPVEKLGISGNIRFVNPNGTTSRITALPSGTYSTGTSGGAAVCFQRIADGGGGSDEIFFETHWQGNRHGESCRINKFGNLAFPSGQGIDFSATADAPISGSSMSNELLDDYEEGSFTPVYYFGGTTSGVTQPSGNKLGRYTKIGNRVFFNIWITGTTDTSTSGTFQIGGLPYNNASGGSSYTSFSSWVYAGFTNHEEIIFRTNPGDHKIQVQRAGASVYASEMGQSANYMISGHYIAS